jgi:hypothetical protein
VTHRIDIRNQNETVRYEFHGLLDAAALASIEAAVASAASNSRAVLVLRSGTEVDRSVLPALQALKVTLEAESPYLARWLARDA